MMRLGQAVLLLTFLGTGCRYAPHQHIEMVPRWDPSVSDGSRMPADSKHRGLSVDGHYALIVIDNLMRTDRGAPPPYVLRLQLYASASAYDSLRIDSISIRSSLNRSHAVLPPDSFPLTLPMQADPPAPPQYMPDDWEQRCAPRCARLRANYRSAEVLRPDMRAGERLTVTFYVQLIDGTRRSSAVLVREFRASVRRHAFAMITV